MSTRPVVLFLCVHNSGRSLAARVLLEHYAKGRVDVRSAGSDPATELNPSIVKVLEDRGFDVSREVPKRLLDQVVQIADVVVTMGCGDTCPVYPNKRYLDWEIADPAGKSLEAVIPIIDEIDQRVRDLLVSLDGSVASP